MNDQISDANLIWARDLRLCRTMNTYDPITHRYFIAGEEVPSVTRILKRGGVITATNFYTDAQRDRGSHFHLAAEYFDQGRLDWASVTDPVVTGRLRALLRFYEEQDVEIVALEQQVYCPRFKYAGTFDRILRLRRLGIEFLVDFKPNPEPWHRLQLAAYGRKTGHRPEHRACLYVREDGSYRWIPKPDPTADTEFLRLRQQVGETWRQHA